MGCVLVMDVVLSVLVIGRFGGEVGELFEGEELTVLAMMDV